MVTPTWTFLILSSQQLQNVSSLTAEATWRVLEMKEHSSSNLKCYILICFHFSIEIIKKRMVRNFDICCFLYLTSTDKIQILSGQ